MVCLTWVFLLPIHLIGSFRQVMPTGFILKAGWLLVLLIDYGCVIGILGLASSIVFNHLQFVLTNSTTLEAMGGPSQIFTEYRKSRLMSQQRAHSTLLRSTAFANSSLNRSGSSLSKATTKASTKVDPSSPGYYFPRVGHQKEEFGMVTAVNNFHMMNGTKLELQDDQLVFVSNMLYQGVQLTA